MLLLIGLLLNSGAVQANNITVSNISLTQRNATDDYTMVQFDLSWENSWRTSNLNGDGVTNWDAAWVFVKYRVAGGVWQHAWLNNDGHSGTGATIYAGLQTPGSAFNATTNPGVGVFIYRSADGTGTFSITGAKLRWNYGANGVAEDASVEVKVFAIEMVYVPEGAFYVGSGGAESGRFKNGTTNNPFLISSEGPLEIGNENGKLWGSSASGENTIGGAGTLGGSFPKGYASFYCMKYEVSQQQYVDFLNSLTRVQQNNRTGTDLAAGTTIVTNRYVMSNLGILSQRNGIRCDGAILANDPITFYCDLSGNGTGGESNDGQWIACNFLSWMDGAAYADWAGLRPMTELEFEKACRGTITPVANEYIWGTTDYLQVTGIDNSGTANETASNSGAGISVYGDNASVKGPLRVGALASAGTTTRATSGSSYYGIKELGGNLWERPVTIGNTDGRAFTGLHGDGALNANGHANQAAWPGLVSGAVTGAGGTGHRGSAWSMPRELMRISDRSYAVSGPISRGDYYGCRAVRSWGL